MSLLLSSSGVDRHLYRPGPGHCARWRRRHQICHHPGQRARSSTDAHAAANTIATSPLVKTAFFGGDANWGRFLAAAGRSGAYIEQGQCAIFITGGAKTGERMPELQLVAGGTPLNYSEERASEIFRLPEIDVRMELGLGDGTATVWTTDLSYEYVKINGDYRT